MGWLRIAWVLGMTWMLNAFSMALMRSICRVSVHMRYLYNTQTQEENLIIETGLTIWTIFLLLQAWRNRLEQ